MNKQQENINFFNKWARSYDSKIFQFWMKSFHKDLLKTINLENKPKILDISCGTGELLKELKGKAELTGLDISEEMLKKARTKLPKEIKLIKADVHKLPFEDKSFDYAITTEAFHHYTDQLLALQEMKRVAKKVIVVDINFFLRPIHRIFEKLEPGCVKVNNKKEMIKLFKKAKLKDIKQKRNFIFAVTTKGKSFINSD